MAGEGDKTKQEIWPSLRDGSEDVIISLLLREKITGEILSVPLF
jgi:hypothetical protein